ncbi:hypothetical protein J2W35_004923 [Variovorax boronicumulans]|uniref:hypothetical protein n=1 Tax=Variovorax boronicumulans TaxID=436515 RepID=UPI002780789D|nr:hypothetical protein [Variovorax boronicumulans]MDQ0084554.1 hypothetical protein [Variovorax boronicumulans]
MTIQAIKDNAQYVAGVLIGLTPYNASTKHKTNNRIAQNANGEWMLDGEIVRCGLGGHEGKARHLLFVKQFQEADAVGRARLLTEWSA